MNESKPDSASLLLQTIAIQAQTIQTQAETISRLMGEPDETGEPEMSRTTFLDGRSR